MTFGGEKCFVLPEDHGLHSLPSAQKLLEDPECGWHQRERDVFRPRLDQTNMFLTYRKDLNACTIYKETAGGNISQHILFLFITHPENQKLM